MGDYATYTSQHRGMFNERPNMAQEGDEGYCDTHWNEDYSNFRQAAACKSSYLWVGRVLQGSDSDEGNPGRLKEKFNNFMLIQCFA